MKLIFRSIHLSASRSRYIRLLKHFVTIAFRANRLHVDIEWRIVDIRAAKRTLLIPLIPHDEFSPSGWARFWGRGKAF